MGDIYVAFPSGNAQQADKCLKVWRELGYKTAVMVDWPERSSEADIRLQTDRYSGWAPAINRLCSYCIGEGADIVVCGNDDIYPDVKPARQLADEYFEHFKGSTFGVMQPTGDRFGNIDGSAIAPWLGREFIERINGGRGPYWEAYRHLYSDTELWAVGKMLGIYCERRDVVQFHAHWSREGCTDTLPPKKRQFIVDHQDHDRDLFYRRKEQGFPGHEPLPAR